MDLRAPVINNAAPLWIDDNFLAMACVYLPSPRLLPTRVCGVRKTSAAYNVRGTATAR